MEAAVGLVSRHGHTRIPAYEGDLDHIIGVLYAKDLLRALNHEGGKTLREIARKPYFTPESNKVQDVLRDLRKNRVHMAIVVDEYGGTAGAVTIEDIIEEIVGPIQDEYDVGEEDEIQFISPNEVVLDGRVSVDDVNDLLKLHIAGEDYDSIGGYVLNQLGATPKVGAILKLGDADLRVEAVQGTRIKKVRIHSEVAFQVPEPDQGPTGADQQPEPLRDAVGPAEAIVTADTCPGAPPTEFRFDERVSTCDVCGLAAFKTIDAAANIVQCEGCGYRFVNPRPSQAEIAAAYSNPHFYDGWIADDAGRHRMWTKRARLVRRQARGSRILDVGAGIGTFLAIARTGGWQVAGTEVSTSARRLAQERYGVELMYGQAEDLHLPAEAFDVVTLWHVLEHVPSPSRLLRAVHTALVPGGCLIIAVPNDSDGVMVPNRLKARLKAVLGRPHPQRPRYERLGPGSEIHLSHFTAPVLQRLLNKEGFRFRTVSVDDHYPNPTWKTDLRVGLYRLIYRVSKRHLGEAMFVVADRD